MAVKPILEKYPNYASLMLEGSLWPLLLEEETTMAMADEFSTMMERVEKLNNGQKKDLAVKTLDTLPAGDKSDVASRTGLGLPSQGPTDMIWVIIVITFALVLVGSAGSILYGVVFLGQTADKVQIVLTIFTTVAGFIAGLISPSPFQGNKNNNPQ